MVAPTATTSPSPSTTWRRPPTLASAGRGQMRAARPPSPSLAAPSDPSSADAGGRLPLHLRLRRHRLTWRPLTRGRQRGQHDLHLRRQRHARRRTAAVFDKDDGYTQYTDGRRRRQRGADGQTSTTMVRSMRAARRPSAFSGASDPSSADTSAGFRYSLRLRRHRRPGRHLRRGRHRRTARPAPSTTTARFTVYGRIFDKDDGYTQYTTRSSPSANVAPQNVDGGNDQTVNEGRPRSA